jgi:dTDP-4-amino-4,6-dideoxygalactose transaminase
MINVTKTFFPPLEEYNRQLERVWKNEWLTNRGELLLELELEVKEYLGTSNIIIMNNGTIPLQIALKILGKQGEVITTPFSYIATSAAIIWENCTPVFVDIHSKYLTIDESKIEAAITPKTTAILATHVFGNPCNIEYIESIAKKHNLYVIYDAAHCFGVSYLGKSIFEYGDVSTCSFHATKLFHTGEGGALFCSNEELRNKMFSSHNFGHNGPIDFHGLGINGKISELNAAMGLSVLPYMTEILECRKRVVNFYDQNLDFRILRKLELRENTNWNYSYYPIIFESEEKLLEVQAKLNKEQIFPRRYFFPSLNTIKYINGSQMPISEKIASCIMCLPLYKDLEDKDLSTICYITNSSIINHHK